MPTPESAPRLGDYVRTRRYRHLGRVTALHFSCPHGNVWRRQQVGIRPEQFTNEYWVDILVHDGGAVCVPISDVVVVEPFHFEHRFADMYFRD
jgi:hypothetical protein